MKFEATASLSDEDVERIADAVYAKLKANATVVQKTTGEAAPEKPATATKPRGKAKEPDPAPEPETPPAPSPEAAGTTKLSQDDVQVALKDYAKKHTREAAFAILKKYAGSVAELSADDLQKVIDELSGKAPAAPAEDDPF